MLFIVNSNRFFNGSGKATEEEIFDISAKSLQVAINQRHTFKRKLLAEILAGSTSNTAEIGIEDAESLIKVVENISPTDMEVFSFLLKIMPHYTPNLTDNALINRPKYGYEDEYKNEGRPCDADVLAKHWLKIFKGDINNSLLVLENNNLIQEITGNYIGYGGGCYNLTYKGARFVRFIAKTESPS